MPKNRSSRMKRIRHERRFAVPGVSSRNSRHLRMMTRWMSSAPPVHTPDVSAPVHRARQQPDGDDQKQDHRRRRDAVLGELAQQFVIEHRPRAAGRGQPIARLAHVLRRQPPLGLRRGGGGRELVRFADRIGHCRPGLRGAGDKLRQKWPKFLKTRLKVVNQRGEKSIVYAWIDGGSGGRAKAGWRCRARAG